MAFPTTSILDDFNRANSNPLDGNWAGPAVGFSNRLLLNGNAVSPTAAFGADYYTIAVGPSFEGGVTLVAIGATDYLGWADSSPGDSSWSGYFFEISFAGGTVKVWRADSGTPTQLGADVSQAFANGDAVGINRDATTGDIELWRKPSGGSWGLVATRNDSTYDSTDGNLWIGSSGSNGQDDFFGGTTAGGGGGSGGARRRRILTAGAR